MSPLRSLLQNLIDYAGLFPPSALPMANAVDNYVRYRSGPEGWMLARFVTPVARLYEFEECMAGHGFSPLVSALIGANLASDLERIARCPFPVDTIELKASDAAQIESAMKQMPPRLTPYFEVSDAALIPAIQAAGARAKIRTGGVTPEAFPSAVFIAQFIEACARTGTAFKATAGLHHPLRCYRPLTYSADGPSGWMFGFLNVFLAAVLARKGVDAQILAKLIEAASPDAFTFSDEGIGWAGHNMSEEEIADARREFAISFGSCSFEEPVADLKELQLL